MTTVFERMVFTISGGAGGVRLYSSKFIIPRGYDKKYPMGLIGTVDIETYVDKNNQHCPYLCAIYYGEIGFIGYKGDMLTFKVGNERMKLNDCISVSVAKLILFMRKNKVSKVLLYGHNLSSFDGLFLLKCFIGLGYKVSVLRRDGRVYQLVVKIGNRTIEFRCSLLLLSASLEKCALSFELDRKKTIF